MFRQGSAETVRRQGRFSAPGLSERSGKLAAAVVAGTVLSYCRVLVEAKETMLLGVVQSRHLLALTGC